MSKVKSMRVKLEICVCQNGAKNDIDTVVVVLANDANMYLSTNTRTKHT